MAEAVARVNIAWEGPLPRTTTSGGAAATGGATGYVVRGTVRQWRKADLRRSDVLRGHLSGARSAEKVRPCVMLALAARSFTAVGGAGEERGQEEMDREQYVADAEEFFTHLAAQGEAAGEPLLPGEVFFADEGAVNAAARSGVDVDARVNVLQQGDKVALSVAPEAGAWVHRMEVEEFAPRDEGTRSMHGDTSLYGTDNSAVNVDAGLVGNIAAMQDSSLMRMRQEEARKKKEQEDADADSDGGWDDSDG